MHSLSEARAQLEGSEQHRAELEAKYEFQVDISRRVARHYNTLKNSLSNFEARYAQLSSSLEQSRQLFDLQEAKVAQLEQLKVRVSTMMASKRERNEKAENLVKTLERTSSESVARLTVSNARVTELQGMVESNKQQIAELTQKVHAQGKENAELVELTKKQASLIDKHQAHIATLSTELQSTHLTPSIPPSDHEQPADDSEELRAKVALLQLQLDAFEARRAEYMSEHQALVDSLTHSYQDSEEKANAMENTVKALEKENSELRAVLMKQTTIPAHFGNSSRGSAWSPSPRTTIASATLTTSAQNGPKPRNSFGSARTSNLGTQSNTSRPKTTASANPRGRGPTTKATAAARSPPRPSVFSSMDLDDEDDIIEIQPSESSIERAEQRTSSDTDVAPMLDLQPTADESDHFQPRGLRCCDQPASGLTVSCAVCHELFHVQCLESARSAKALGKNKNFVCASCDPSFKSPKGRRGPRLDFRGD